MARQKGQHIFGTFNSPTSPIFLYSSYSACARLRLVCSSLEDRCGGIKSMWSFRLAGVYEFLSGVMLGTALNMFSGLRLAKDVLPQTKAALYGASIFLFATSLGLFAIGQLLGAAREAWTAEGSPPDPKKRRFHIEERLTRLRAWLLLSLVSFILAISVLARECVPFISLWSISRC